MISILVALLVIGVVVYIVTLIPMNETVRKVLIAVALLFAVLWLLQALGLWSGGPEFPGGIRG